METMNNKKTICLGASSVAMLVAVVAKLDEQLHDFSKREKLISDFGFDQDDINAVLDSVIAPMAERKGRKGRKGRKARRHKAVHHRIASSRGLF